MLTQEQLENRTKGIGGSDSAALFGLSEHQTALDVYVNKIYPEKIETKTKDKDRGNALEDLVLKLYEVKTGKGVRKIGSTLHHPSFNYVLGNVDGYIDADRKFVEAKTCATWAKKYDKWGSQGTDEIPDEYLIQCAHYLLLNPDVNQVDIPVIFGNEASFETLIGMVLSTKDVDFAKFLNYVDFRIYTYHRHSRLESAVLDKAVTFWNENVLKQVPPAPVGKEDITKLYPVASRNESVAGEIEIETAMQLKQVKQSISNLEKEEKNLTLKLKEFMADSCLLKDEFDNNIIKWGNQASTYIDRDILKNKYPEIWEEVTKTKETRVFRLCN